MDFEELVLSEGEEFEKVVRHSTAYRDPVVNVGYTTFYFNQSAAAIIPKFIKWLTTPEYIIGLPTTEDDKNAYSGNNRSEGGVTAAIPAMIKAKKPKKGVYKVMKFRDGFAFKRYEPIEEVSG